tara:strand:- start:1084 stop:1437 length:354 start_codon:yes stop_codon:yes gene_type:complete
MNEDVSSKDVMEKDGTWYVVFDDGETMAGLVGCSVVYLTEGIAEHLSSGSRLWRLQDEFPDEDIKMYDLGDIFDFYKESYGSDWEDEIEKINDLVKEASIKDQYDRYVDKGVENENF